MARHIGLACMVLVSYVAITRGQGIAVYSSLPYGYGYSPTAAPLAATKSNYASFLQSYINQLQQLQAAHSQSSFSYQLPIVQQPAVSQQSIYNQQPVANAIQLPSIYPQLSSIQQAALYQQPSVGYQQPTGFYGNPQQQQQVTAYSPPPQMAEPLMAPINSYQATQQRAHGYQPQQQQRNNGYQQPQQQPMRMQMQMKSRGYGSQRKKKSRYDQKPKKRKEKRRRYDDYDDHDDDHYDDYDDYDDDRGRYDDEDDEGYGKKRKEKKKVKKIYIPVTVKKPKKKKMKIILIMPGFFIAGGTQIFGKFKSLKSCQQSCGATPSCFAGDYNPWLHKCYLHTNFTACSAIRAHKKLVHFKKIPCEVPEAPEGRITLGAQLFRGIEQKGIKSLSDCLKKCATAGTGIPASVVNIGQQLCFGIDYDFGSHKCYFHVDNTNNRICPADGSTPLTPRDLVANPAVVNILLCESKRFGHPF